jgi:hypothetical protein
MMGNTIAATLLLVVLACGCDDSVETPFPEESTPVFIDNEAPPPPAPEAGVYAEELTVVLSAEGDVHVGHARGYIAAPIVALWEQLKQPEFHLETEQTDDQRIRFDVDPQHPFSFEIHYTVRPFPLVTVEWDERWLFDILEGSAELPTRASVRYKKVSGTSHIRVLEGQIVLTAVAPGVTEIAMVKRLDADRTDAGDVSAGLQALYRDLLLRTGRPLPPEQ